MLQRYEDVLLNKALNPVWGASITVKQGGSLSAIYDGSGMPMTNPVTTAGNGNFWFYAVPGVYQLTASGGSPPIDPIAGLEISLPLDELPLSGGPNLVYATPVSTSGPASLRPLTIADVPGIAFPYTPENVANKQISTSLGTSDTYYPSQNAVKVYVDTGLATKQSTLGFTPEDVANKSTDGTLAANSDTLYASQKATKTYVDTGIASEASARSSADTAEAAARTNADTTLQTNINAKEDVANKDTTTTLGTSNIKYPSQNAVKVYVDTGLATKANTSSLALIATSGKWSDLQSASADLTLANAGYNTTFNQTAPTNWNWANALAATNVPTVVFTNDGSSLAGWQTVTGSVDAGIGNPAPSLKFAPGTQAQVSAGIVAGSVIQFDFYFYNAASPLFDFYFGGSNTIGQNCIRIDARAANSSAVFTGCSGYNVPAGANQGSFGGLVSTLVWHTLKLAINATGASVDVYLDNVFQLTANGISIIGPFLGVYGDGGTTGANVDNISVTSNVSTNHPSPKLLLSGTYYDIAAGASAVDTWTLQNLVSTTAASSTLNVIHTGANSAAALVNIVNPTAATSLFPQPSPVLSLLGQYWNGSASATDLWTLQDVVGAGTNGPSALTFAHTGTSGAATVTLANSVLATSGVAQNSPLLTFSGQYWTGSASLADKWTIQDVIGTGTNGSSVLTFSHSGSSSAQATVQVPGISFATGPAVLGNAYGLFQAQGATNQGLALYTGNTAGNFFYIYNGGNLCFQLTTSQMLFQNPTAASAGASTNSPTFNLSGQYWNGSTSATDSWTIQNVIASGTNGLSTLAITHSGSANSACAVQVPGITLASPGPGGISVPGIYQCNSLSNGSVAIYTSNTSNTLLQLLQTGQAYFLFSTGGQQIFNPTNATVSVSQSAAPIIWNGKYWNGVSAGDTWQVQPVLANGTNGASTLTFSHTAGTTGAVSVQMPTLTVAGGFTAAFASQATNYTLTANDFALAFSATATATLPSGMPVGKMFRLKNTGAGATLTISPASGLIDGSATRALNSQYQSVDVIFDGTNWMVY